MAELVVFFAAAAELLGIIVLILALVHPLWPVAEGHQPHTPHEHNQEVILVTVNPAADGNSSAGSNSSVFDAANVAILLHRRNRQLNPVAIAFTNSSIPALLSSASEVN